MTKICNKCQQEKSLDNFFNDKNNKTDGKYSICKVCKQTGVYKWRNDNRQQYNDNASALRRKTPERTYGYEIKRRYGCTLEEYNELLIKQEAKCKICKELHNPAIKKIGRLYVDHDHKTGKIRGLLCHRCNCMLGYAKDDLNVLIAAISYLKS